MRKWLLRLFLIALVPAALATAFSIDSRGPAEAVAIVREVPMVDLPPGKGPLVVATLNVAHGRAESPHQLLLGADDLASNLRAAGAIFVAETPHALLVQELDGPSWWSGNTEQGPLLARGARLPWVSRGRHVEGWGLNYGAAVLSASRPLATHTYAFDSTPPTPPKGFVVVTLPYRGVEVDVVSVHLDFGRAGSRAAQVEMMLERLKARGRPLVLGGDLNCDGDSAPFKRLIEGLTLHSADPEGEAATFPATGARIDWILASEHFRFRRYAVLPASVSDHRAVVAALDLVARPSARPAIKASSAPTGR
jgi:endonuclease/exonuclease/phosphatase family metal-dependent hydrolase